MRVSWNWLIIVNTCAFSKVASGGCLGFMSCWTLTGVVVANTSKTSVRLVKKMWLILSLLPFFSPSFVLFVRSSVDIFMSFILCSVCIALYLSGALWDVTSGSAFRAIG